MRCLSCNNRMSPFERTRKTMDGEYLDLCNTCYHPIKKDVPTVVNPQLINVCDEDTTDDDFPLDKEDDSLYNNYGDEEQ